MLVQHVQFRLTKLCAFFWSLDWTLSVSSQTLGLIDSYPTLIGNWPYQVGKFNLIWAFCLPYYSILIYVIAETVTKPTGTSMQFYNYKDQHSIICNFVPYQEYEREKFNFLFCSKKIVFDGKANSDLPVIKNFSVHYIFTRSNIFTVQHAEVQGWSFDWIKRKLAFEKTLYSSSCTPLLQIK